MWERERSVRERERERERERTKREGEAITTMRRLKNSRSEKTFLFIAKKNVDPVLFLSAVFEVFEKCTFALFSVSFLILLRNA